MLSEFLATVGKSDYVVLDTETTGIKRPAQIIEIAIYDPFKDMGLVSRVKSKRPIPYAATAIHGISDAEMVDAPSWIDIRHRFWDYLQGKTVVVYNAAYDRQLMHWTDEEYGLEHVDYRAQNTNWICAMEAYAEYYGEIDSYYGSYRWQRLSNAVEQCGFPEFKAHGALQDAMQTHKIVQYMLNNPKGGIHE